MYKRIIGTVLIAVAIYLFTQDEIVGGGILFVLGGIFFGGSFDGISVTYNDGETELSVGDVSFGDGGDGGGD